MGRLPIKDILFRWKLPFINAQAQPGSIPKPKTSFLSPQHQPLYQMIDDIEIWIVTKHPYTYVILCFQYCYKMTRMQKI